MIIFVSLEMYFSKKGLNDADEVSSVTYEYVLPTPPCTISNTKIIAPEQLGLRLRLPILPMYGI